MAAPTFVNSYSPGWSTNPATLNTSVTVANGDTLVVFGMTSDASTTLNTPYGGSGVNWTLQKSYATGSYCALYVWTATGLSAQTFTLSIDANLNGHANYKIWGFRALRFNGGAGIGASAITNSSTGTAEISLTTTGANSAIAWYDGDWNAVDPAGAQTYDTGAGAFTELDASLQGTNYVVYGGYHADAGAAGSKTLGVTSPTGQKFTIAALEILGGTAGNLLTQGRDDVMGLSDGVAIWLDGLAGTDSVGLADSDVTLSLALSTANTVSQTDDSGLTDSGAVALQTQWTYTVAIQAG